MDTLPEYPTYYLEGGSDSAQLETRCHEGFRKLLAKCGFYGRDDRANFRATFVGLATYGKIVGVGAFVSKVTEFVALLRSM